MLGRLVWGSLVTAGLLHFGAPVQGQVSTTAAGSILVFPRVVVDETWDTAIQIGNSANRPLRAVCVYTNAAPADPGAPPGPFNPPLWAQTDFPILLTRQQATQWVASRGRAVDPTDPQCSRREPMVSDCGGAGYDPGNVPPLPATFTGELRCIEVDASGAPWSGNGLAGVATLTHLATGEIVKYKAIGFAGYDSNNADATLCLGGEAGDGCPSGSEYAACPQEWVMSHPTEADDRPVDGAAHSTAVTVTACSMDLLSQVPPDLAVQFRVTNEFGQIFAASTTVVGWGDVRLSEVSEVFQRDLLNSNWAQTDVRPAARVGEGFLLVQSLERRTGRPQTFTASGTVPPYLSDRLLRDLVVLPQEVGQ